MTWPISWAFYNYKRAPQPPVESKEVGGWVRGEHRFGSSSRNNRQAACIKELLRHSEKLVIEEPPSLCLRLRTWEPDVPWDKDVLHLSQSRQEQVAAVS